MGLTFANLGASSVSAVNPDIRVTTDLSSYANTSWTPPTVGVIVAIVFNWLANPGNVPTISGNGITWTQIATGAVDPGQSRRITLFAASAIGSSAGITTVDFAGQTQLGCMVSFFHMPTDVDISGGLVAAFPQVVFNNGTGTSGSVTLAAAGHANNRCISAFNHAVSEATTPDAAWTELDDMNTTGPAMGVETQYKDDSFSTSATASWTTSADWYGMAAEVKCTVSGTVVANQVTETDTAQPISRLKTKIPVQVSGTNTAQPISRSKIKVIGQAQETSTAFAVSKTKYKAILPAIGYEIAESINTIKFASINQVTEVAKQKN